MAELTTHVLDTARGRPAAGVPIRLYECRGDERTLIKTTETNAGGRTSGPLLAGQALRVGVYELVFGAGQYFRTQGETLADPPFLGEVVIRFGVADPSAHYHVPLLLSPYGYSTYRGS
ncbi:MAG TPA: hydroxyisourate hydrolase [Bryobacteraceae bacterium]|nr:hydroxyisourate hydrolase [Bryobacteraceae bacterium]